VVTDGISVVGNVNVDVLISPTSTLPPPGAEWPVDSIELRPGGAAANAGLTLAGLGSPPLVTGCVGDDDLGRLLLDELARAGIHGGVAVVSGARTGVSVGFEAPGRDRSFFTSLGSLASFDVSLVPEAALERRFVLLCGYNLLPRMRGDAARQLLRRAHDNGATTLFDAGWDLDDWPEPARREVADLLPLVDVFLPNDDEATALTGEEDPLASARALQGISGGWVVVKRGAAGCVAAGPDGAELTVPAPPVDVTDTTGAGDAFNAGLLHALARDLGWEEALTFATRVASTVVSRPSADRYPTLDELVG
jgi:sugar/nucleoside kinase (ribokinase family)